MKTGLTYFLQQWLVPLVTLAGAAALIGLIDARTVPYDLSHDGRNSLSARTVDILGHMDGPIEMVAFVPDKPALRDAIARVAARYQRHHATFTLRFVDPRDNPSRARAEDQALGEVELRFEQRRERLRALDKSVIAEALERLARGAERWVTVLVNNGERRVERGANHDLSELAQSLSRRGIKLREFSLNATTSIPDNTALLLIASPAIDYLPSELFAIEQYLDNGGNLLLMSEPEATSSTAALESAVGVKRLPGTIVDPTGQNKFRNPAFVAAIRHPPHPVTEGFSATVALPYAAALTEIDANGGGWQASPLLQSEAGAWTETSALDGLVAFDDPTEREGPLVIAYGLKRERGDGSEQRAVVIGDGDVFANSYVNNLGNIDLGHRVVDWLVSDDAMVTLSNNERPDARLVLTMAERLAIASFILVIVPFLLILAAFRCWWRVRRA